MTGARVGLARSVQTRLVRHAKEVGIEPNLVLTRYAIERFLYRLSQSPYAERFVLKGALLMLVWLGETLRPTRDADLLGFGDLSDEAIASIFTEICKIEVEPDGLVFLAETVQVEPIRLEDGYGGRRVKLSARLGAARLQVQVDVGIGDATVPPPRWLDYPALLDLPKPRLRTYAPETVVAEKLHAMVLLGIRNSRMKDYFDLHALAHTGVPDFGLIGNAIAATFERRRTPVPNGLPIGLTNEFARDPAKQAQWGAFLRKNGLAAPGLEQVVADVRHFLAVPLQGARGTKGKP